MPLVEDADGRIGIEMRVLDVVRVGGRCDASGVIDDAIVRDAKSCKQGLQAQRIGQRHDGVGAAVKHDCGRGDMAGFGDAGIRGLAEIGVIKNAARAEAQGFQIMTEN